jgi:hypothetical protein
MKCPGLPLRIKIAFIKTVREDGVRRGIEFTSFVGRPMPTFIRRNKRKHY